MIVRLRDNEISAASDYSYAAKMSG